MNTPNTTYRYVAEKSEMMSRHVYKYGKLIGLVRHGDTSDIEIYNPEGKYVGRVVIEADSEERREQIRDILRHWTPAGL